MHGKRILIIQQRNWGVNIGHFLAKKLAKEGCVLAAVTYKKSAHEFHATQKDVHYEILINNDEVFENPTRYVEGNPASLEAINQELGIESIWPLVAGSREITRSYAEKFYYNGRQQMSDEDIVRYVQGAYAYVRKIFDEFKPDAVIAPLLAEPSHLLISYMARMRGIKTLCAVDSRVNGVWILSESPYEDEGAFHERVDALNAGASSENTQRAEKYIAEFRKKLKIQDYLVRRWKTQPFFKRVRMELAPLRRIWEWYTRPHTDCIATLGPSLDCRPPRIILRDYFTKKLWSRTARSFSYYPQESVGRYVYYPLQVEPEVTLDVFALYFKNQRELARIIALSLPADYTLVVKDHPDMLGFRPPEYLKDLAGTPNIKLIDYRIPSETVLKGASLVIAPNSTAMVEAAMHHIPVIQFGEEGIILKLPNVLKHTDPSTLSACIKERLRINLKTPEYERRLKNFVAAAYDTGFELDYISAWEDAKEDEREKIWDMYRAGLDRIL